MSGSETVGGACAARLAHAAVVGIVAGAACAQPSPHTTTPPVHVSAPDRVSVDLPAARSAESRTPPDMQPGTDIATSSSAELMKAFPGEVCCKGQNECKGKGNCKTARNDCKGLNECKGQGGCKAFNCQNR